MSQQSFRKRIVKMIKCDDVHFRDQVMPFIIFADSNNKKRIYNEINTNPFFRNKFMGALCKGGLREISSVQLIHNEKMCDKEAIEYAAFLIELFAKKVERYVELRQQYERNFLKGEFDKATAILDELDKNVCVSMWSCGQRCAIKELNEGLESNKKELSRMLSKMEGKNIFYIVLYYFSCMAEQGLSFSNYQTELMRYISAIWGEGTVADYLKSKLSFDEKQEQNNISLVLQIDSQCSIIDLFNSFEWAVPAYYQEEICKGRFDITHIFRKRVACTLYDNLLLITHPELDAVNKHLGDNAEILEVLEWYTQGKYESVVDFLTNYLSENPADFQMSTILCKALILCGVAYPKDLNIKYIKNVYSIYAMSEDYREALLSLKQETKLNHGLILGGKIQAFLLRKQTINADHCCVFASSILDPVIHPNFLRYYKDDVLIRDKIYNLFEQFCPTVIGLASAELTGNYQGRIFDRIDKQRLILSQVEYLCSSNCYEEADALLSSWQRDDMNLVAYQKERISKVQLKIESALKRFAPGIKRLVKYYFENEFLFEKIQNSGSFVVPQRLRSREIESDINYVIYRFLTDPRDYKTQISAYNNFLDLNGYSNVLDALALLKTSKCQNEYRFFFDTICSVDLLKRDSTLKMISVSPENARLTILFELIEHNQQKKYLSEVQSIITSETIKDNLQTIEKSRINIDTDKILLAHREQWEEMYSKYLTLLSFSPLYFAVDIEKGLDKPTEVGFRVGTQHRINQTVIVLSSIIQQIVEECLLSTQYGLETYLSSRIRHGYCGGQLTGFLNELHLLSMRKSEDSDEYTIDRHWEGSHETSERWGECADALAAFTKCIELKISEVLGSWLRIRYRERTIGLLDYSYFEEWLMSTLGDIEITDFVLFYNGIIDRLWEYTDVILKTVRDKINGELTQYYLESIAELEIKLEGMKEELTIVSEMLSNCQLAKSRAVKAMRQFADVFSVNQTHYNDFTMEELASSCKKVVEKAHREAKKAKWVVCADNDVRFKGAFFAPFVDALCILLNNAIEHSGMDSIENLEINVEIFEITDIDSFEYSNIPGAYGSKKVMCIKVTNSLGDTVDRYMLNEIIAKVFAEKSRASYNSKVIQSEGGSGLFKLCNTLQYNIESRHSVYWKVEEETVYFQCCFVADKLICKEEVNEDTFD